MDNFLSEFETALAAKTAAWKDREAAGARHVEAHDRVMTLCKTLPLVDGCNLVGGYVITKTAKPGFLESEYVVKKLNFIDPAFTSP